MSIQTELEGMARRAAMAPGSVAWDEVHHALARHAKRIGEWAGVPMPVQGMRMIIAKGYPFADRLAETFMPETRPAVWKCKNSDVDGSVSLRNSWHSYRDGKELCLWHDSKGFFFSHGLRQNTATMLIDTIGAARGWDFQAELRAQETLKHHITEWAWQCYMLTGTFLETSQKSGIHYVFRRLRPTIAMTSQPSYWDEDKVPKVRLLAALCQHPVGFVDGSWAGVLVPTDDCLSHLLLMRADEHHFWKKSNQHHPSAPEAGI